MRPSFRSISWKIKIHWMLINGSWIGSWLIWVLPSSTNFVKFGWPDLHPWKQLLPGRPHHGRGWVSTLGTHWGLAVVLDVRIPSLLSFLWWAPGLLGPSWFPFHVCSHLSGVLSHLMPLGKRHHGILFLTTDVPHKWDCIFWLPCWF